MGKIAVKLVKEYGRNQVSEKEALLELRRQDE